MEIIAKIDFAFKEIMKNPKVLKGFLSAVLKIPFDDICSANILDSFLGKEYDNDKLGILDVRVMLNNKVQIDIEIQLAYFSYWSNRSLFYLCKMYSTQLFEAEDYRNLKKCVSISILDFELFKDSNEFYSLFQLTESKRGTIYTDHLQFHILELPKLPKTISDNIDDSLYYWGKFLDSESEEEIRMLAKKNEYIDEAIQELDKINLDEYRREEYFRRRMVIMDYNTQMNYREEKGRQEGRQEGKQEGKQEGMKLGAIKYLLDKGTPISEIAKEINTPENEVENMIHENNLL